MIGTILNNTKDAENKVFGFDKTGYLSDSEIEKLYQRKLELVTDKAIQNKIFKASFCDPRKSDIYFDSEESANIGKSIADKLNQMSENDFFESDYSWKWFEDLSGDSLFKITNKNVLNKQINKNTNLIRRILQLIKEHLDTLFWLAVLVVFIYLIGLVAPWLLGDCSYYTPEACFH